LTDTAQISGIVSRCIDQVNGQLPESGRLTNSPGSVLADQGGVLDSLSLVTLCVGIEQELLTQLGLRIPVLDTLMEMKDDHPMRTVGTLVGWIERQAAG
jgi:acyl carrier protein